MFASLFVQIFVLLIAAVLCNHVMGKPLKTKDDCSLTRRKPSVGILRIRYFLFGDDSISQEELELSDLFDQEPTAGRDKIPPSGTNEKMRPTDQMGQPNQPMRPGNQMENQPTTKPPVPNQGESEGQQINPQNPEILPVNPPMVDPSNTGVPLPDESVNQLEQQPQIKNPDPLNPNPPGQSTQMREPISEFKDRNQEPLEQLNTPKILQQPKSQQPQQQPFQPQQQPQQPQQELQQLQQQLQQGQPQQPQQQPQQEFQPQQQQLRATERRKRWQPPFRQVPSDYDDSYPRYERDFLYPRSGGIFRQADDTQRSFDGTRPATNTNTDLHVLDDRSGFLRPRNDGGGVDIDLNV
jgi:hypothetical protein